MRPIPRVVLLAGLLATAGCGTSAPDVTPAQGVIKLNGKVAPNMLIQFNPMNWPEGTPVVAATAVSGSDGTFVLKAHDGRTGATAGKHKVTIIDNNLNVEEEYNPKAKRIVNRVPQVYSATTTTPIEIEIVAGKSDYEVNVGR